MFPDMIRLFVALRPPPEIRARFLSVTGGIAGVRWQTDAQLHLTLRFIGKVDRHQARDIEAALAAIHGTGFDADATGVGSFSRRGRTDTLWIGIAPRPALVLLQAKVEWACVRAGLAPERRTFHPHVTVARLPRSLGADPAIARWLGRHAGFVAPAFACREMTLYESRLGSDGAHYEPLARWPLGTPASLAGSPGIVTGET